MRCQQSLQLALYETELLLQCVNTGLELLQLLGKPTLMADHVVQNCFVSGVTGAITHPKQETTAKTGLKDL